MRTVVYGMMVTIDGFIEGPNHQLDWPIIDDELQVADILRRMLADEFDVEVATEAPQAMKMVLDGPAYDVLLCDLLMPGMDGVDLVDRLSQVCEGFCTLFTSGYTDRAILRQGALAPGAAFIEKPFSVDALARKVRAVLDKARRD